MERIGVIRDELQEVLDVQGTYLDGRKAFSCNESPSVGAGYGNVDEDRNLKGKFSLLDQIVELVCENSPDGSRFHVSENGAYLLRNNERIAEFVVID